MNSEIKLPTLAGYKPQCMDSSHSWVIYQSSVTDLTLIQFTVDFVIKQTLTINISMEPVKAVRIIYSEQQQTVYVGIALLTKYLILKKNQVIKEYSIPLQYNIVDFNAAFTGVEAVNDGKQIYFAFVTRIGQIMTVPIDNLDKGVTFSIGLDAKITSLAIKNRIAYLGTEDGMLLRIDMNSKKMIGKYNSQSEFPIFHTKVIDQHVIIATCDGQLHILDEQLKQFKVVAGHKAMITILAQNNHKIYSIGDDLILRVWQFSKQGILQYLRQQQFNRRPNVLFTVFDKTLIGFYEESLLQQI